jgi:hypothetical protein
MVVWMALQRRLRRFTELTFLLALSGTPMTRGLMDLARVIDHVVSPGEGWTTWLRPSADCDPKRL